MADRKPSSAGKPSSSMNRSTKLCGWVLSAVFSPSSCLVRDRTSSSASTGNWSCNTYCSITQNKYELCSHITSLKLWCCDYVIIMLWFNIIINYYVYQGSFLRSKVARAWSWPITPTSGKVKNVWSYTSTSPYICMVWCLVKHQGQLYLYLTINIISNLYVYSNNYKVIMNDGWTGWNVEGNGSGLIKVPEDSQYLGWKSNLESQRNQAWLIVTAPWYHIIYYSICIKSV
jgi:hypothetical protein